MNESFNKINGYVYILEVKDIDLPVCKIGRTSRNPYDRCEEINNSSTGDFIWNVAFQVAVDDCKKLESLVHKKLQPLRQKKREFFNINSEVAYKALLSIMDNQSEIKKIIIEDSNNSKENFLKTEKKKTKRINTFRKIDSKYTELLQYFTSILRVKGRPFGQLNKPGFGMSDGNEGVQWNIVISTDDENVHLGVNLEGMKYSNWPIANLILSELEKPTIKELKTKLENLKSIFIQFKRDAWQVTSRPDIVEKYFCGREFSLLEMDSKLWISILEEALTCLNEKQQYRGRNKQTVTLAKKPRNGEQIRIMDVSPHLAIRTQIDLSGDTELNLRRGILQLEPVYKWMTGLVNNNYGH